MAKKIASDAFLLEFFAHRLFLVVAIEGGGSTPPPPQLPLCLPIDNKIFSVSFGDQDADRDRALTCLDLDLTSVHCFYGFLSCNNVRILSRRILSKVKRPNELLFSKVIDLMLISIRGQYQEDQRGYIN